MFSNHVDSTVPYSFFAVIAILQFFSEFSTISPGLVILPLLIVLAITGIKDGYEDIKRHQSDRHINTSKSRVLGGGEFVNPNVMGAKDRTLTQIWQAFGWGRKGKKVHKAGKQGGPPELELAERGGVPGVLHTAPGNVDPDLQDIEFDHDHEPRSPTSEHRRSLSFHVGHHKDINKPHWKKTSWEDVKVGDVVKITNEESFPADILICATSEEENVCYVETKNLDGETNLKSRNAVPSLTHLRSAEAFSDQQRAKFNIELDRPDVNMYKLNGAITTEKDKQPFDLSNCLLRGTVLKNTKWVVGIVMFTGEDTKIILNAGGTPSKRSKVERQMNPQV